MATLMLIILFVVVLPLAEGVLLACVLREVYIRHPLPLGGTIGKRPPPKTKIHAPEAAVAETTKEETAIPDPQAEEPSPEEETSDDIPNEPPPSEPLPPKGTGLDDLPVNDILAEMMAEIEAAIPGDLERTIEEAALPITTLPEIQALEKDEDEKYDKELDALTEMPPEAKIDFTEQFEGYDDVSEDADTISPLAKELFGEDFNFESLEKHLEPSADKPKDAALPEPDPMEYPELPKLAVFEDETGTVQVSSPFMSHSVPQLAGFSDPQTILPTFSSDWIQETGIWEPIEGDAAQFCHTEESRPMFTRKSRAK